MKKITAFAIIVALCALIVPQTFAAERYHTFLFGVAYYPEHWAESYWEQDATRMQECGVNVVRMAEFAWAVMEPTEGTYDFSLFDKAIAVLARHGIKTILGTPTATPPKWLTQAHTDVLHVNAAGEQVVNDALLLGGGAFAGNLEFHVNVVEFLVSLLAAALGNRPEVGGVVSDKSQLLLLAAGRAADEQEGDEHAGKQSGVKGDFHALPLV